MFNIALNNTYTKLIKVRGPLNHLSNMAKLEKGNFFDTILFSEGGTGYFTTRKPLPDIICFMNQNIHANKYYEIHYNNPTKFNIRDIINGELDYEDRQGIFTVERSN